MNFTICLKNNIIPIDEIGFSKRLNPLYSWSVRGKTKYIKNKIVSVKNRNISVCSCITSNGDIKYDISNKPFNRESFLSFLQNLNFPKGTILLIVNVSFHHSKIVKEYITEKGWISLYTPPYSPKMKLIYAPQFKHPSSSSTIFSSLNFFSLFGSKPKFCPDNADLVRI